MFCYHQIGGKIINKGYIYKKSQVSRKSIKNPKLYPLLILSVNNAGLALFYGFLLRGRVTDIRFTMLPTLTE